MTTVGGWGPALADQASGHRVGLEALRALFLALDADAPTTLLELILRKWNLATMHGLVEFANRVPAPDFSELAPVIVAAADAGDPVAVSVLRREAGEMAHLVHLLLQRLSRDPDTRETAPEVAFAGSMLEHVPMLRRFLIEALQRSVPGIRTRQGVVDPLLGALWRARS